LFLLNFFVSALSSHPLYRFYEIIPAALVWTTFLFAIVFSFFRPLLVIIFIILFSLFWLLRVIYFVFYLSVSWRKYKMEMTRDWQQECAEMPQVKKILHLVVLPTYGEPFEVLDHTFQSLVASAYPKGRLFVVLAGESRDARNFHHIAQRLKQRYGKAFFRLLVTLHPENLPGEIRAKGANAAWAGQEAKKIIDELGLSYDDVIVSYFDCDTCVHPLYFHVLSATYLTEKNPTRASYQPITLYNNNIWDSPAVMRVSAFSTTFWLMTELARPDRLFTFSSHAMSFRALVDVGFWQRDIVTDDSRIFLQCFLRYDGDYRVVPLYVPVSMDTAHANSWRKSLLNLYRQQRRWGWGIEHLPYMLWHFPKRRSIPWSMKLRYLWNLGEGMYFWATAPILLFVLGHLPIALAQSSGQVSVLAQNAPYVLQWLMGLSMIGVMLSAVLGTLMLPRAQSGSGQITSLSWTLMVLQWLLLPLTLILFGSIPATEAQTRLMFGRYMGFDVTQKARSVAGNSK